VLELLQIPNKSLIRFQDCRDAALVGCRQSLLGFEAELRFAQSALSAHQHREILWESQVSGNNTLLPRPFIIMTNTAVILSVRVLNSQCILVQLISLTKFIQIEWGWFTLRNTPDWDRSGLNHLCVRWMFKPLACNCLQMNHKACRLRENLDKTCCNGVKQNRGHETRLAVLKPLKNSSLCGNGHRCLSLFAPSQQSSGSHSITLSFWQTGI